MERSAVTLAEIVAAGRKHETHAGALTVTLRPAGRHGGARLPARFRLNPATPWPVSRG